MDSPKFEENIVPLIAYSTVQKSGASAVATLNAHAENWRAGNYMEMYKAQQYESYQELDNFLKLHKLDLDLFATIVTGRIRAREFSDQLKSGNLKCDFNDPKLLQNIYRVNQVINTIKPRITGSTRFLSTKIFWISITRFAQRHDVDWDHFIHNLEPRLHILKPMSRIEDYHMLFIEIYNFNRKSKEKRLNMHA